MPPALRSILCGLAVAFAVAAPASAQQPQVTTSAPETQAPVCAGTTETAPPTGCTSGDAADGAPGTPAGGTVGGGQVITDPADQVDGDGSDAPATPPKRGEQHVLGGAANASSSDDQRADASQTSQPAAAPAPDPAPATTSAPVAQRPAAAAKTLPFTGVNAGYLALAGATLLLAGLALRRRAAGLSL